MDHIVLAVQLIVCLGLVIFWHTHNYGTDYRRFLRTFFSIEEGFFLSQTFLFIFQAAIFTLINIVSYSLVRSFFDYFKNPHLHSGAT